MREANDDVDGFFGLDQFHIGVSQPTQKIFPPPRKPWCCLAMAGTTVRLFAVGLDAFSASRLELLSCGVDGHRNWPRGY